MSRSHRLGSACETLAASYLEAKGWSVLARNFRFGHREIDLIARRGDVVAFIEVKARSGTGFGHPLEAITGLKRSEIQKAARAWIAQHGGRNYVYRFDAIAIIWDGHRPPVIE